MAETYDVIVIGAGAAGLMAAATAGQRGRRVLVVDHARRPGRKVRLAGGGRCNFTNRQTGPACFVSANPRFCISALRRYPPEAFIDLVERYGIPYTDRGAGQLFCRDSSRAVLQMLLEECRKGQVAFRMERPLQAVHPQGGGWSVAASDGRLGCASLVVATGGLSYPRTGASGLGYTLAQQLGVRVQPTRPALVPLIWPPPLRAAMAPLAGISCQAGITAGPGAAFEDAVLMTHEGVSGPASFQASLYWSEGAALEVDWLPGRELVPMLIDARNQRPQSGLARHLEPALPRRLARALCELHGWHGPLQGYSNRRLEEVAATLQAWRFTPAGTAGYAHAEVTAGGVDTSDLSSKTMAAREVPGLFFAGEVMDVTGQLGGHNLHWAWASGVAAGQHA